MIIAVDAMGGDKAPAEIIKGVIDAVNELDIHVNLVGREDVILNELSAYKNYKKENITITNADEVITGNDAPVTAIRKKKNSSMVVGLNLLKDRKVDAFLSAGNTGAFMAGCLLIVGRIKGTSRPALAPLIPSKNGAFVLIDAGSNSECDPINLLQFAVMGGVYAEKVLGVSRPRIGLVNIGEEEEKGNQLVKEAYKVLKNSKLNFIGNIEGRDLFSDKADVVVCDGFTGNVILKTIEGVSISIFDILKEEISKKFTSKLGALLMKSSFRSLKKRMDYTEHGGAPFLGIDGVCIKAHGSSNAKAIKNALRQTKLFLEKNLLDDIKLKLYEIGADHVAEQN